MTGINLKQFFQALLVLVSIWASFPSYGVELRELSFINQDGKPIKLNRLGNNYLLMSFIFTRCPVAKMCPLTLTLNQKLEREWLKKGKPFPLHFLMATLDPEGDTPKALKDYAIKRGISFKNFTFITGSEVNMAELTSFFDSAPIPGQTFLNHRPTSVLLNPNLEVVEKFFDNHFSYDLVRQKVLQNK